MSKVYDGDDLLVISGLHVQVIQDAGLGMDTFRYDPVLIEIYFSCEPCAVGSFDNFKLIPVEKQMLMRNRVVDLGIPHHQSFKVLKCCERERIPRGTWYKFDTDGSFYEYVALPEYDDYIIA